MLIRKVHHQAAILKHPVIARELTGVALVHVDVVDAVPWQEAEVLVLDAGLRSPPFAERIHDRTLVGDRPLHHAIDFLVQIVVEPWQAERQRPHLAAVEQVAPDEVERRRFPAFARALVNPLRNGSRTSVIGC